MRGASLCRQWASACRWRAAPLEEVSLVARSAGRRTLGSQRRCFARRIDGYLQYYGKLKNQEGMLRDGVRLEAYRAALEAAIPRLQDAVVMDIGTGSGILAFLAARYGARKVYAVEASPPMSRLASRLVRSNGLVGVVEVIPKHLEDITEDEIPRESVDVIVSELFSHFMVGELGPQAVTYAKSRFLREGGLILPAKCIMKLSPFEDKELAGELRARHRFWLQSDFHGFDLSPAWQIAEEQMLRETILDVVEVSDLLLHPDETPGKELDLAGPDDPSHWRTISWEVTLPSRSKDAVFHGICGWWDAIFEGAGDVPPVLSTAPGAPPTVWAQSRFLLERPLAAEADARLVVECELKENKLRESYTLSLVLRNKSANTSAKAGPIELSDVHLRRPPLVQDA